MRRSTDRILTTHVGSLPRPDDLLEVNRAKVTGESFDERLYAQRLTAAVSGICRRQAALGVDIVNDGEFGKASIGAIDYGPWASYIWARLDGWGLGAPGRHSLLASRRDRAMFADFYREFDGTGFISSSSLVPRPRIVTGPITYRGLQAVRTDLDNLKAALAGLEVAEGFVTSIAPGSFSRQQDSFYKTDEEFQFALAEAHAAGIQGHHRRGLRAATGRSRPARRLGCGESAAERSRTTARSRAYVSRRSITHLRDLPDRSHPLSHMLGKLARTACHRSSAPRHHRRDADGPRGRLFDRGRQCPSRARMESVARREAARRQRSSSRALSATQQT